MFYLHNWKDIHNFAEKALSMKKVYSTEQIPNQVVVDIEDGQIIRAVTATKCTTIPDFIICYLSTISDVWQLDGNTLKVLIACWMFSSFNPTDIENSNTIYTGGIFKDYIRKNGLNIGDSTIDKCIHILSKKGFIIKRQRGCYYLNPKYFYRGTLNNKSKLQHIINFNSQEAE